MTLKEPITKEKRSYVSTQFQLGDWEKYFINEFGKRYINYRKEWEQAGPNSIPDFPLHIDFQLIDDCNMRCTFCPRNSKVMKAMDYEGGLNNGTVMSLDVFKKIIDEGEKFGLPAINLGASAEPLMHPDVVEMVRYARNHGVIDIRIISNGLRLGEKMARNLFEAGLTYLSVSLDAWKPDTYKITRQNKKEQDLDALELITKNVLRAVKIRDELKLKFPRIRVSFVDTEEAKGEFEPFLNFWKHKVDFVELQDLDDYGGSVTNNNFTCIEPHRRVMVWASNIVGCIAWTAETYPYGNFEDLTIKECWDANPIHALRKSVEDQNFNKMCLGCYGKMELKS